MKATQEYDWKRVGDTHFMYRIKNGKVMGQTSISEVGDEGPIFTTHLEGEGSLGEYVNLGYAKAALLEAASTAITRKTTKRV